MSAPPNPPLKRQSSSPASHPRAAGPAPAPSGRSAPEVVAVGVRIAVRPDPRPVPEQRVIGGLRITAPRGAAPTAASWCVCGRDLFAAGHRQVLALIADHTAHRDICPRHTGREERNAA